MKDKHGVEIRLYHQVIVPEPNSDDSHQHSFIGTVANLKEFHNTVVVEDQDADTFEINHDRLIVMRE